MEPRKDEKTTEVRKEAKPSRFRIDKLEERIAPKLRESPPTIVWLVYPGGGVA